MINLKALVICVEYDDILAITLPRMLNYFDEVLVVTSNSDAGTRELVRQHQHGIKTPRLNLHMTNTFYLNGDAFNKGAAVEEGLDVLGREGWICLIDADILLPAAPALKAWTPEKGNLYTPLRRMLPLERVGEIGHLDWKTVPFHDKTFHSGYFQLFHADDPVLKKRPWYSAEFGHAGKADFQFQKRWAARKKLRPPHEVIHIGECDRNWFGRTASRLDGKEVPAAAERAAQMDSFLRSTPWGRARLPKSARNRLGESERPCSVCGGPYDGPLMKTPVCQSCVDATIEAEGV